MYAINASTGILTPLSTPTITTGNAPQYITMNSAGTAVYVANYSDNSISMYAINASTGILTPLSTPTITTGNAPVSIAVTP